MIKIRPAKREEAAQLAELLNEIVAIGGTTALTIPMTAQEMLDWMETDPEKSSWLVAEAEDLGISGFQCITPADYLPEEAAEIGTYTRIGATGRGIGSALFEGTKSAARTLGYGWINANIRADNSGGLAYYSGRGFTDYGRIENYKLPDGLIVDKILKRYDL